MVKPVDAWLLPDGVADVLPAQAARLETLRRELLDHFARWGYALVMPPLMEYLESLLSGSGRDLADLTFKITDQLSGRMMGVRADTTPQVARLDAHCIRAEGPARYCYAGSVLHTRPIGLAASRCPVQIGAELYGHAGVASDIEILRLLLDALAIAGAQAVHLDLGHVGIFRSLAEQAALSQPQIDVLRDQLVRKSLPEWADSMNTLAAEWRDQLLPLPQMFGDASVLTQARRLWSQAAITDALHDLQAVVSALAMSHPQVKVSLDLADVRGYHYHTGLTFSVYVPGEARSVAKGGRYDHVGEAFGRARPATGFSADLKQWLQFRPAPAAVQGILAPADDGAELLQAITQARAHGQRVVQQLPGAPISAAEAKCDREFYLVDGSWQVRHLSI